MRSSSIPIPCLVVAVLLLASFRVSTAQAAFPTLLSIQTLAGGSSSTPCAQAQFVTVDASTGTIVAVCGNAYIALEPDGSYYNLTLSESTCQAVEILAVGPDRTLVAGCILSADGTLGLSLSSSQSEPWALTNNTFATAQVNFAQGGRMILTSPIVFPPTTNLKMINVARDGSDMMVLALDDGTCGNPGTAVDYDNNILWTIFCNNTLFAMDPMTGAVLKSIETPYQFQHTTSLSFIPSSGLLYLWPLVIGAPFAIAEFNPSAGTWRYLANSTLNCVGNGVFAESEIPSFLFLQCNTDQPNQPALVAIDLQPQQLVHHSHAHSAHQRHDHAAAAVNAPYAVLATGSVCSTGDQIVTGVAYRPSTQELILNCIEGVLSAKLQF